MRAKEPGSCRIFARPGNRRRSASRPAYGLSLPVSAWCFHPAGERSRGSHARSVWASRHGSATGAKTSRGSRSRIWCARSVSVLEDAAVRGTVNMVAPQHLTNAELTGCACAPLSCFAAGRRAGLDRAGDLRRGRAGSAVGPVCGARKVDSGRFYVRCREYRTVSGTVDTARKVIRTFFVAVVSGLRFAKFPDRFVTGYCFERNVKIKISQDVVAGGTGARCRSNRWKISM